MINGSTVAFSYANLNIETNRRPVLHLNLVSVVKGSTLNWCAQNVVREVMSENLLFGKLAKLEMTDVSFNNHSSDRTADVERGHIEVFPKFWNL